MNIDSYISLLTMFTYHVNQSENVQEIKKNFSELLCNYIYISLKGHLSVDEGVETLNLRELGHKGFPVSLLVRQHLGLDQQYLPVNKNGCSTYCRLIMELDLQSLFGLHVT